MPKQIEDYFAAKLVAAGIAVAIIWTFLTGAVWPWLPIATAVAVILFFKKISDTQDPPKAI